MSAHFWRVVWGAALASVIVLAYQSAGPAALSGDGLAVYGGADCDTSGLAKDQPCTANPGYTCKAKVDHCEAVGTKNYLCKSGSLTPCGTPACVAENNDILDSNCTSKS